MLGRKEGLPKVTRYEIWVLSRGFYEVNLGIFIDAHIASKLRAPSDAHIPAIEDYLNSVLSADAEAAGNLTVRASANGYTVQLEGHIYTLKLVTDPTPITEIGGWFPFGVSNMPGWHMELAQHGKLYVAELVVPGPVMRVTFGAPDIELFRTLLCVNTRAILVKAFGYSALTRAHMGILPEQEKS